MSEAARNVPLTAEAKVRAWLDEVEGFGLRVERLSEDLRDPLDRVMPWLVAACQVGMRPYTPAPAGEGSAGHKLAKAMWGVDLVPPSPPSNGDEPSNAAKLLAYDDCHAVAVELGYPSMTEALEALARIEELEGRVERAVKAMNQARSRLTDEGDHIGAYHLTKALSSIQDNTDG